MAEIPTPEDIAKNIALREAQQSLIVEALANVPEWQELWAAEKLADISGSSVLELAGERSDNC